VLSNEVPLDFQDPVVSEEQAVTIAERIAAALREVIEIGRIRIEPGHERAVD
jgi:hypothetical protein